MKSFVRWLMKMVGIREYEEHVCPEQVCPAVSIPAIPLIPATPVEKHEEENVHKYVDGDIVITSNVLEFPNGARLWIE